MKHGLPTVAILFAGLYTGCSSTAPRIINAGVEPEANFFLYVSNQSFSRSPIDIRVQIDGRDCVDGTFYVRNQHRWKQYGFKFAPGPHTVVVSSQRGGARVEETFTLSSDTLWAVVSFWYDADNPDVRPAFTFEILDEAPRFI